MAELVVAELVVDMGLTTFALEEYVTLEAGCVTVGRAWL
jgi:hypothetical protein